MVNDILSYNIRYSLVPVFYVTFYVVCSSLAKNRNTKFLFRNENVFAGRRR